MNDSEDGLRKILRSKIQDLAVKSGHLPGSFQATDKESLFLSGLLDSLSAINMVLFLETRYKFNAGGGLNIVAIDSIDAMVEALLSVQKKPI